jgi:hypothetical protein
MWFSLKRFHIVAFVVMLSMGQVSFAADPAKFTTDHFLLTLSDNGQIESFVDLRNGINYADTGDTQFCVLWLNRNGVGMASNNVVQNGEMLTFSFPGTSIKLKLQVTTEKSYLVFDVAEITGGNFYTLQFARVPLTIDYVKDDFAACAMSRNLNTKTLDYPGKSNLLGGQCFSALGYEGAGVFLLGMPEAQLRETMKHVVETYAPGEMPVSRAGGPYAMDIQKNYGSYFIIEEAIHERRVDDWVEHLSRFGINQVDFVQGGAFRQGDFQFDINTYPNGISDFRKTSEAFRRHGFNIGLHTYSQFLPGDSKYVTPIPSKDLDVMRTFTLSNDLGVYEQTVPVDESTTDVSEVTGFFVRNSKVIRIDDELILFEKPSHSAPYGFASCTRGAFRTRVAVHKKGAPVDHLTQMFNLFAPKKDSELFLEIARQTARAYNEGGFDMIYLDALDGTYAIVDDYELTWYYDALFVNEILKHTNTPPLLEYSTFSPNLWYGRSRMGAWDENRRGYRRSFDIHIEANRLTADRLYLSGQMGWLSLCPPMPDDLDNYQYHIMFKEDVEYLGAKILAYNYGLSYVGIDVKNAKPCQYRNGERLKRYDSIRIAGQLDEETRQRLRDPKADFLLHQSENGWYLTEANYAHILLRPDVREFSYHNPYSEQTPMIRIEHRHQPVAYDSPQGIDLLPLEETQPVQPMTVREFSQPIDLSEHLGLGLWVYGDGGGQNINVRLESPAYLASGHTDHIVTVDFTGWRYFALAEADNGIAAVMQSYSPLANDMIQHEFRNHVYYNSISKIQLIIQGKTENLRFRTIRALPLAGTYLIDPVLQKNGQKIIFRGKVRSGHYMEYQPGGSAAVYDAAGNEISVMQPDMSSFKFLEGNNTLQFSGATESGIIPCIRITLRTNDDKPLGAIEKKDPVYTVPTDLYAIYGQILSDVTLPPGWSWMNETLSVGDVGVQTHKAKFTPEDTENYKTITNIDVKVTITESTNNGENLTADRLYAWVRDGLLHVAGLTPGEMLSIYTVTSALVYHNIVTSEKANTRLKAPGIYIVQSEGKSIKVVFE